MLIPTSHDAFSEHRTLVVSSGSNFDDVEAQVEAFMQMQAEKESGLGKRKKLEGQVLGAAEVPDDMAQKMCADIVKGLKVLKEERDMTINEVKLIIAIEDPRARERRLMGIEDSSGISRDEMADALMEVVEGKIPQDRIALRELHKEIISWPFIETDEQLNAGEKKRM